MTKLEFIDEVSADIQAKMSNDLSKHERSCGVDINYKKFSLTINENNQAIAVLNAYTAYSEIYMNDSR